MRNTHTTAPWTTAYICLTLDDSCTDAEGKYVQKPLTVRMVQWQPYQVKTPFDPKTPVCSACKKTNRTRSFCRERHKHSQLPWCTVYVLLSALETADPSTVVADPSKPVDEAVKETDGDDEKGESKDAETGVSSPGDEAPGVDAKSLDGENVQPEGAKQAEEEQSDDINDIAESRTFLAKVNCRSTTIHWLELADFEGELGMTPSGHPDAPYAMGHQMQPMDPNHPYYHAAYAAQQHHNTLKSHQQYFFHMQRQHQAAQYAAWQAHYNPPPPHHVRMPPPPHDQQHPQQDAPANAPVDMTANPAPVMPGDQGASHLKRSREMAEGQGHTTPPPPPPPPPHMHGPPPAGHQPHGQQPQWMMYQPMYPGHYPPRPGQPQEGSPIPPPAMGTEYAPPPQLPEGNGDANHDSDAKRHRRI